MTKLPRLLSDGKEFHPIQLSISENIVPLSTASMQLPKDENLPAREFVELFTPLGSAGIFRVRSPEDAYGDDITSAELEHAISEVGDYLVRTKLNEMMAANTAMSTVFSYYGGSRWQLGSVSALGTGQIAMDVNYERVLDAMLKILEQKPDCMMAFNFSTSPWTVSIVNKDTSVSAEGRLSRNVQSARVIWDDTELCTRLYYEIPSTDSEGQPISVWTYIDSDTISTYGRIEREMTTGSDFTTDEANAAAAEYLRQHKNPRVTVDIDAEELSEITGETLDTFRIGKLLRLALPDYNTTIEQTITGLNWTDVYNDPGHVVVRLGDEEDTVVNFLHDVDAKGGSGGGGGAGRSTDQKFKEYRTKFEQDDYHFNLVAQHVAVDESILEQAGLYIDSHGVLVYAEDYPNNLGSKLKVQADKISMVVGTNVGGNFIKAAEIATSINNAGQGVALIAADHVNISSTSTAHLLSGSIKYDEDGDLVLAGSSGGGVVIQHTDGQTTAKYGVFDDGTLTAGVIATKVNGVSSTNIYADKILMSSASGANNVQVEVNGKITANDITAQFINSLYASAGTFTCVGITASGNIVASGGVTGSGIYVSNNGSTVSISDPILDVKIADPADNVYKLQYKSVSHQSWTDAGSFSRATALSGAWSSGTFSVSASPQGNSLSTNLVQGTASWNGNTVTIPVEAIDSDNPGYQYATGRNISLTGVTNGTFSSVTAKPIVSSGGTMYYPAGTATTLYNAGTTTKTARGDSVTAKPIVSSGGTVYYKSGGTVNQTNQEVYKSAGPGAYYDSRGNFVANGSIYPSGAAVLYTSGGQVTIIDSDSGIRLGDSTTYYKGNGGDFTVQGSSTSVTPIASASGVRLGSSEALYRKN